MKTSRWLVACAAAPTPPLAAQAQDSGTWLVRARALYLDSADKDSTGFGPSINNKSSSRKSTSASSCRQTSRLSRS